MTLDEAIKHCEELAKLCDDEAIISLYYPEKWVEKANYHRQMAEWLKELKAYRESRKEITRKMNSGQWSEGVVYGLDKAVRIMEKHLREETLMSEYRKIYYPSCPYCQYKVKENLFDYNYGKLVAMVTGRGSDNVVLKCDNCGEMYRVTCSIKFYSRRVNADEDNSGEMP